MLCKLNTKGQLQIPSSVRKQFNMQFWQLHDLDIVDGKIVITPAPDADKVRYSLKQNLYKKGFTDVSLKELALQQQHRS